MATLKKNWPIISATLVAVGAYILFLICQKIRLPNQDFFIYSWASTLWLTGGILYTNFFEYLYHRFVQHVGIPGLKFLKISHTDHHRVFHGLTFQSDFTEDLTHITLPWFTYPILFLLHYLVFLLIVPTEYQKYAPVFFLGITVRFLVYEIPHFLTHHKNNKIDEVILRIPIIGHYRKHQIEKHERHHLSINSLWDFSFSPFDLDGLFGTEAPPKLIK